MADQQTPVPNPLDTLAKSEGKVADTKLESEVIAWFFAFAALQPTQHTEGTVRQRLDRMQNLKEAADKVLALRAWPVALSSGRLGAEALRPVLAYIDPDVKRWQEAVISAFALLRVPLRRATFWELDSNPRQYGYKYDGLEWHWKLRRVRNCDTYGPKLFTMLDGNDSEP